MHRTAAPADSRCATLLRLCAHPVIEFLMGC